MYTGIMIFLDFCLIHLQIDILGGSNNAQVFAVFGFVISMTPGSWCSTDQQKCLLSYRAKTQNKYWILDLGGWCFWWPASTSHPNTSKTMIHQRHLPSTSTGTVCLRRLARVRGNAKGRFLCALDVGAGIGQGDSDSWSFCRYITAVNRSSVAREKNYSNHHFFHRLCQGCIAIFGMLYNNQVFFVGRCLSVLPCNLELSWSYLTYRIWCCVDGWCKITN